MEEKRKIGIDIDEVVAGFMEVFLEYTNNKKGTTFTMANLKSYHLWESGIHGSKEESIWEVGEFQNSSAFDFIQILEGAKEGIQKISKYFNIYFITSRPVELENKTIKFFNNHFPKNNFKFIFSGEIHGGKTKGEICNELGVSLFVEDNAEYALDCAKRGVKTFLLEKPWNENHTKHDNIIKVRNW